MAKDFTIGNALSVGWNAMKKNFVLFLYITLTFLVVQIIMSIFDNAGIWVFIFVLALLANIILKIGLIDITLNVIDGKKATYKQLYSRMALFPDYLIGTVLYILIILGGLILLIVPGIIWAIKYQFYGYYIVDKRLSPTEAIKASGKATDGYKWKLLGFWFACVGVIILGVLALLVGLFAAIPTVELATAYVYRTLSAGTAKAAKKATAKKKR